MTWTKQGALDEIDQLIGKIGQLQSGRAFDADHVRWRQAAIALLEEVFGQESVHLLSFVRLNWQPRGQYVVSEWDLEQEIEIRKRTAYLEQLETAKGILWAAQDELKRKELSQVYRGKNTGPETSAIVKVLNLVDQKLRVVIREAPRTEKEVQDAFENLLVGADVAYSREAERIEYSSKTYTPDFSLVKSDLAVEVKLSNRMEREKEIIAEINDDILAYTTKYGNVLFVVYDTGFIRDVNRFASKFQDHNGVMVRVVKH